MLRIRPQAKHPFVASVLAVIGLLVTGCLFLSQASTAQVVPVQAPPQVIQRFNIQGGVIMPRGVIIRGRPGLDEFSQTGHAGPVFVTDRQYTQRLLRAQELLADEKFEPALRLLQSLLDEPQDWFYQPEAGDATQFRSLKAEALDIIATLPPAALRMYKLDYVTRAAQLLQAAEDANNEVLLAEVARRYLHTEPGAEAVYRLGVRLLDRGEPLDAALRFESLARRPNSPQTREPYLSLLTAIAWSESNQPELSLQALERLRRTAGGQRITVGGQVVTVFERSADAADWFERTLGQPIGGRTQGSQDNWLMVRGNSTRTALGSAVTPVGQPQWSQSTLSSADPFVSMPEQRNLFGMVMSNLVEELDQQQYFPPVPSAQPLIVGELAIVRTAANVRAVHLRDGKVAWESSSTDRCFSEFSEIERAVERCKPTSAQGCLRLLLAQRTWLDNTFNHMSSDGEHVFAIEDTGFLGPFSYDVAGNSHPFAARSENRLHAYDAATGKLRWQTGGPAGSELPLAGMFFLGPPLPLRGKLYCLGESGGETSLLALSASTGKLLWKQTLVESRLALPNAPGRRLAGLSPSYSGGVLICPTAGGAVVGVDLANQMLLWGYRYDTMAFAPVTGDRWLGGAGMGFATYEAESTKAFYEKLHANDRWLDHVPVISGRSALVTPRDSQELHCLDVNTGKLQWAIPRRNDLYIGGVFGKQLLLIGRNEVRAVDLADGTDSWTKPVPIPRPTGRGIHIAGRYLLPVEDGTLVGIDLQSGRVASRTQIGPGFQGNLVSAGGRLIVQSHTDVAGYADMHEVLSQIRTRLKDNPQDADGLKLRARVSLYQGNTRAAIADLRLAVQQPGQTEARQLLTRLLLDTLEQPAEPLTATQLAVRANDFATVQPLVQSGPDRLRFLELWTAELERRGDVTSAFHQWLQAAKEYNVAPALVSVDGQNSVHAAVAIQQQIVELYQRQNPAMQAELDRTLSELVGSLPDRFDPRQHDWLLSHFRRHPAVRNWLTKLMRSPQHIGLQPVGNPRLEDPTAVSPLLQEHLLLTLLQDPLTTANAANHRSQSLSDADIALQAEATARYARLLIDCGYPDQALPLIDRLDNEFASRFCLAGRTGARLADEWRRDLQTGHALAQQLTWKNQTLKGDVVGHQQPAMGHQLLKWSGPRPAHFQHWHFFLHKDRSTLLAEDGYGRPRWQVRVAGGGGAVTDFSESSLSAAGHLLVLNVGTELIAIDALRVTGKPQVLYRKPLTELQIPVEQQRGLHRVFAVPYKARGIEVVDDDGNPLGRFGGVTWNRLCYQWSNRLTALDPLTGTVVWERDQIARRSEPVTGQTVISVFAPDREDPQVFRLTDGSTVSNTSLVPPGLTVEVVGEILLGERPGEQNKTELYALDLATGKQLWSRSLEDSTQGRDRPTHLRVFPASTIFGDGLPRGGQLVLLDKDGLFLELDLRTGRETLRAALPNPHAVRDVHIEREDWNAQTLPERYLVFTNADAGKGNPVAVSGGAIYPLRGSVTAIERKTRAVLWSRVCNGYLYLNSPGRLPVLLTLDIAEAPGFNRFNNQFDGRGISSNSIVKSLTLLDRRTGEEVFASRNDQRLQLPVEFSPPDPNQHTFRLSLGGMSVEVIPSAEQPQPNINKPGTSPPQPAAEPQP